MREEAAPAFVKLRTSRRIRHWQPCAISGLPQPSNSLSTTAMPRMVHFDHLASDSEQQWQAVTPSVLAASTLMTRANSGIGCTLRADLPGFLAGLAWCSIPREGPLRSSEQQQSIRRRAHSQKTELSFGWRWGNTRRETCEC